MSSGTPRQPGQSPLDAYPELRFDPDWGSLVRRKRIDLGMSQQDLANAIGCDQPLISFIERGTIGSSRAVIPISDTLDIPVPSQFVGDELDRRWVEAGRVLRRLNEPGFQGLLLAAET